MVINNQFFKHFLTNKSGDIMDDEYNDDFNDDSVEEDLILEENLGDGIFLEDNDVEYEYDDFDNIKDSDEESSNKQKELDEMLEKFRLFPQDPD